MECIYYFKARSDHDLLDSKNDDGHMILAEV